MSTLSKDKREPNAKRTATQRAKSSMSDRMARAIPEMMKQPGVKVTLSASAAKKMAKRKASPTKSAP